MSYLTHTVPESIATVNLDINANSDDYAEKVRTPTIHTCPGNKYAIVIIVHLRISRDKRLPF